MNARSASKVALIPLSALVLACAPAPVPEPPASAPVSVAPTPTATPAPSSTPSPQATPGTTPSGVETATPGKPSGESESRQDELRVGEATDGATLTGAEVETLPRGAYKLVLSFDGKGPPPVVRSRVENPKLVVIIVDGIRGVTANLPVVTGEGGTRLREPRAINRGPVKSIGRGFYGDDSGIRIDVELSSLYGLKLVEGSKGRSVELVMDPKN